MSNPVPSSLALTTPADLSTLIASRDRNNDTAIQSAVNALIALASGGAASQVLQAASASAVQWAYPPGFQYDYHEASGDINVTGTSSGSPTSVLAGSPVAYDGSAVIVEFFCSALTRGTTSIQVGLYDGTSYLGNLFYLDQAGNHPAGSARTLIVPSVATHTYNVKAFVDAGTGIVRGSGVGGMPLSMRVTKA